MEKKHLTSQPPQQKTSDDWEIPSIRKETVIMGDEPCEIVFPDNSSLLGVSIATARELGVPDRLLKRCKCITTEGAKHSE